MKVDAVESFGGVAENGVVYVVDGCGKLDAGDGEDQFVCCPCLAGNNVVGESFFTLGGSSAVRYAGVC